MRIVYNRYLPVKGFRAINLFGVVFARKEYKPLNAITLNHEAIHTAQLRELGYLPFYLLYVAEWIFHFVCLRDGMKAYHAISFEREAYSHQTDLTYLDRRTPYAWLDEDGE